MTDASRRIAFVHDGHRFEGIERVCRASTDAEPEVHWTIYMDGQPALEFRGPYPYRDEDVHKRVLEWYAIQRPSW